MPRACTDPASGVRWGVVDEAGVSWLVSPCGERVLSLGVNVLDGGGVGDVRGPDTRYHWARFAPSRGRWVEATRERLVAWGFNTVGAWSPPDPGWQLPVIPNLSLGARAGFHWLDPFDPALPARAARIARRLVTPWRDDPLRVGYFLDNEVGWWNGALFTWFIQQAPENHAKQRLVALLEAYYGSDWGRFTSEFVPPRGTHSFADLLTRQGAPTRLRPGTRGIAAVRLWTALLTARYYAVMSAALRAADPGALVFSDRLPIYWDPDAVRALAPHVDVIATNYNVDSPDGWIARYYFDGLRRLSGGKPVLVSEWFFAADENRSGNRNNGHLMTVATQAERARGAAAAARAFASLPEVVGAHWFQYYDHPLGGREDGEDYDFGLVDVSDRPYEELVTGLGEANRMAPALHAAARAEPARLAEIPRADIVATDRSLADWPKPAALLPPLRTPPGEVPFGEAYLAWSAAGLHVALIAMDYYAPDLLAIGDDFPRGEALHLDLGVDVGTGPRRLTLFLLPPRETLRKNAPLFQPLVCRYGGDTCLPVHGVVTRYFGSDQPRLTVEMTLPWAALGRPRGPGRTIRLALGVTAFHASRWMSLDGQPPDVALRAPEAWTTLPLRP